MAYIGPVKVHGHLDESLTGSGRDPRETGEKNFLTIRVDEPNHPKQSFNLMAVIETGKFCRMTCCLKLRLQIILQNLLVRMTKKP